MNAVTARVASRYGTVHFDCSAQALTYHRAMWSVDRLHPSERRHRLLARCFADQLAASGFPVRRQPALEPTNPEPTRRAQAWWMATKGAKWLLHRSTDLVPCLAGMVAAEWWYRLRGSAAVFDEYLRRETADALARLEG